MPVIKGNGYGHGMFEVASILLSNAHYFAVVFTEEALALRDRGITTPILVFSPVSFDSRTLMRAIRKDISFTVYDRYSYRALAEAAEKVKKRVRVHINIDTGMTRLGLDSKRHHALLTDICSHPYLLPEGLYSHLSSADTDPEFSRLQCEHFQSDVEEAEQLHCSIRYQHILNTPGSMLQEVLPGNMVRIGKGIYGLTPSSDLVSKRVEEAHPSFSLTPALTWKTRIIQIRNVPKGVAVGYGQTYVTEEQKKLAILPVGFADGYRRSLSNVGEVVVKKKRCPIRGRVCMNNLIVDVSHVSTARVGDDVVLFGSGGVPIDQLASCAESITTEFVSGIHPDLPRVIVS